MLSGRSTNINALRRLLEGRSRNINARRRICPTTHVLISDNSPVRKIISILTLYRMRMQGYCDVYKWTILKRTSPEVKCLHPTSSRCEMCTLSVSNAIYHKFSHGAALYTLNGKNFNVMLEFELLKERYFVERIIIFQSHVPPPLFQLYDLVYAYCSTF